MASRKIAHFRADRFKHPIGQLFDCTRTYIFARNALVRRSHDLHNLPNKEQLELQSSSIFWSSYDVAAAMYTDHFPPAFVSNFDQQRTFKQQHDFVE